MINYLILIFGYFLIFFSILLFYFRLKRVSLTREDFNYWFKIERKFGSFLKKFLKIVKLSEKEIVTLWYNFIEKILRRIKVEALKIETWTGKRLEKMKSENNTTEKY